MKISWDLWQPFSRYLFIDVKLSQDKKNDLYLKSRFKLFVDFFEDKEFTKVSFSDFIWMKKQKGDSNAYLNNIIKLGKHLDSFLGTNCIQDFTYWKKEKKVIEILTPQEIIQLAETSIPYGKNPHEADRKMRSITYFLGLTGCRIEECLALTWQDVCETPSYVIFRDTKNGDDRIVPINQFLLDIIQSQPRRGNLVFCNEEGKPYDISTINRSFKPRAKLAGITKRVHNHIFRHSYITEMLANGVDISDIAHLVGHRNIQSTLNYKHNVLGHYQNVIYAHPLVRDGITLSMISQRVKELLSQIVDKGKYVMKITESDGNFSINISQS